MVVAVVVFGLVALTWWTGGRPWAPFVGERRFHIPSEAMTPTLQAGDDVWASPLSSEDRVSLAAGDIVIYDCQGVETPSTCVSRVVATEGETVTIDNGVVRIGDTTLDEPYLADGTTTNPASAFLGLVPPGAVVLLGDNRANSRDSRYFGAVPLEQIRYLVRR